MSKTFSLVQTFPRSHERYSRLPVFGGCLAEFVTWMQDNGYKNKTCRLYLSALRRLVPRFLHRGIQSSRDLTALDVEATTRRFRVAKSDLAKGISVFGRFLKEHHRLKPEQQAELSASDQTICCVIEHLRNDRGLAESTCQRHGRHLRLFLKFIGFNRNKTVIRKITLERVRRFIGLMSRCHGPGSLRQVVATLRIFLRWEFARDALSIPLHLQLDTIRVYRDQNTPLVIPWPTLQKLLGKLDQSSPQGLRDYTVLLLAMTYGLRRSEVVQLTLDDVNWRKRQIRIGQRKTRCVLWLPLTNEVEAALIRYLKRGRPKTSLREIFICQTPPMRPLSPYVPYQILGRASRTTGVSLPTRSFHSLRYARALSLLRGGASIKTISDVLGHRDMDTSAHYLRLDVEDLRQVALPVPTAKICDSQIASKFARGPLPSTTPSKRRRAGTVSDSHGWHSFLGKMIQNYLAYQRALGRSYCGAEKILRTLDFTLARDFPKGRIFTERMFAAWSEEVRRASGDKAGPKMMCVRKFCLHLSRIQPKTFVPNLHTFPRPSGPKAPCLLSPFDIARLVKAAQILRLKAKNPLCRQTMQLAILLMYCCGLRLGEVLRLRMEDIDSEQMVLRINHTKFNKSRLVPLSPSLASLLKQYFQRRRNKGMPVHPQALLVWSSQSRNDSYLSYSRFWQSWRRVCHGAGVLDGHRNPPRPHDLRHSFAVEVLRRSYRAGKNPQATLPRLSRYMGHARPSCTHYYLKFTEQLRAVANDRFRQYIADSLFAFDNKTTMRNGGVQ
jgi:integrase/recombinase XerD